MLVRNSLLVAFLGALAVGAAPAPVTYGINFTLTQGNSPESASFTYVHTTQAFTNFVVIFGGIPFDLTAAANAPTIVGTVPCLHGLTGAAATFELLDGKCAMSAKGAHWSATVIGPVPTGGLSLAFVYGTNSTKGPFLSIGVTNPIAGAASAENSGGFSIVANPKIGKFTATGSMSTPRASHTATLLENGDVLVAGGENSTLGLATAELYNPKKGTFSAAPSMINARYGHTATLLRNGQVLIAGGANSSGTLSEAELYNPKTGKFTATGSMTTPRQNHTATLLPDGNVLIAGGSFSLSTLASAEIYNPKTGTFTATGSMTIPRAFHTATRLEGGKILIAGGFTTPATTTFPIVASEEVYDQNTGVFTADGAMGIARAAQTATLLTRGAVLFTGGITSDGTDLSSAELFGDKTAKTLGSMNSNRANHTATLLPDGKVLVAGGPNDATTIPAQLFLPAFGTFTDTAKMTATRQYHTATLLDNGKVLLVGGNNGTTALASAELFEAANGGPF